MAEWAHLAALARAPGALGPMLLAQPGVRVEALAGLHIAQVSLHPGSARRRAAVATRRAIREVLGVALPPRPNTVAGGSRYAVWLAPQRWLVVDERDGGLPAALAEALASVDAASVAASVSDVGDAALVLDVTGSRARTLMAMAVSLDLDAPDMAEGRAARTLFAGQHALLYRRGKGFRVHLDATLAVFAAAWFAQAGRLLEE